MDKDGKLIQWWFLAVSNHVQNGSDDSEPGKLVSNQQYSQDDGLCLSLFRRIGGEAGNHWVTRQDNITGDRWGLSYSEDCHRIILQKP